MVDARYEAQGGDTKNSDVGVGGRVAFFSPKTSALSRPFVAVLTGPVCDRRRLQSTPAGRPPPLLFY